MRNAVIFTATVFLMSLFVVFPSNRAHAGTNAAVAGLPTVSGIIAGLGVEQAQGSGGANEVVVFTLKDQPTSTGCPAAGFFEFSATNIPDANERRSMLDALLAARVANIQVTIVWIPGTCGEFGYAVPIFVSISTPGFPF